MIIEKEFTFSCSDLSRLAVTSRVDRIAGDHARSVTLCGGDDARHGGVIVDLADSYAKDVGLLRPEHIQ